MKQNIEENPTLKKRKYQSENHNSISTVWLIFFKRTKYSIVQIEIKELLYYSTTVLSLDCSIVFIPWLIVEQLIFLVLCLLNLKQQQYAINNVCQFSSVSGSNQIQCNTVVQYSTKLLDIIIQCGIYIKISLIACKEAI